MLGKLVCLVLIAAFVGQARCDEIDDWLNEANQTITGQHETTVKAIAEGLALIPSLQTYLDHSKETFLKDADSSANKSTLVLDQTSLDAVANAVANGKPESVIKCIADKLAAALQKITAALATVADKLTAAHDKPVPTLVEVETELTLISAILPNVLEKSWTTCSTCVSRVCIDSCLAAAKENYDTIGKNVDTAAGRVKSARVTADQEYVAASRNCASSIDDAEKTGVKQINKC